MKSICCAVALVAVLCCCQFAEAARRVTIVRRQRVVAPAPQAVILQRPLQLVAPSVLVPQQQVIVPRQTLIFGF